MKTYKIKTLCVLVAGLFFQSCLDLDPQDQLADSNIWGSANDFELFSNQFYSWTRDFSSSVYDSPHSDKRSDLLLDGNDMGNTYRKGTNTLTASDGNYTNAYDHIRRTNLLLKNAESYGRPEEIAAYVGEAKFFRAYCYFDLLQLFGDAILVKEPLDVTSGELQAKRNDRSEVADFIIQDLREAAEVLPATSEVTSGRVGREGAQAFLSRVALYEGTWQKFRGNTERATALLDIAAKAAKQVIDGKKFELFQPALLGDSAQKYMFILEDTKSNPAGLMKSANKEYIFSRRHDEVLAPIGKNITKECLANVQYISHKFASMYLCSNGLPVEYDGKTNELFQGYQKIDSEFENRDNRMRYTMLKPNTAYWDNDKYRVTWNNDASDLANAVRRQFKPNSGSGYNNQKWATERSVRSNYEGYDYPIIRYAEVLLNYAEAVYERDNRISDEDLNISLNLVRCRVNAAMPKLTNSFVTNNGLSMREEIRRERTVELFNEGFRIDDLKRWKEAEIEMPQDFLGVKWEGTDFKTTYTANKYPTNSEGFLIIESDRQWSEKNYLYPIPSDQLRLNPNLGQNPGWEN